MTDAIVDLKDRRMMRDRERMIRNREIALKQTMRDHPELAAAWNKMREGIRALVEVRAREAAAEEVRQEFIR